MNTISIKTIIIIGIILFIVIKLILKEGRKQDYDDNLGSSYDHISRFNKGVWIGRGRITEKSSMKHTALIAQSGGGKTSACLINSALALDNCSVICFGPADERYEKTAGYFAEKGFDIQVLDLLDGPSICFNPLVRAKTSTELHMLAEMVFGPSLRKATDPFWPTMGMKLLTLIFRIQKALPEKFQNLANTLHLINLLQGSPKEMDKVVIAIADDALFQEYKSMIRHDAKLFSNIVATTQATLKIFEDARIARITSIDTLDLELFRKKKTVLYVQLNVMDARYYSFLIEIFFTQIFRQFMSQLSKKGDFPVYILADEMGSFTIKGFAEALSNLRKYFVSITYAIQSISQLSERYNKDDASTILANSFNKLYFPGMQTQTAMELQTRMGKWSFTRSDGSKGTREVMTVSELVHLEDGYAIYTAGPARPMKIKLHPYYKKFWMRKKSSLPAPIVKGDVPETVQLFKLSDLPEKQATSHAS